mmetsp:Transcript_3479/g.8270  ORF Transcript_3479/g.8270 Transcript_3479/m.8270 type:complete len:165 (+) Transcript_3479:575-1069(+)
MKSTVAAVAAVASSRTTTTTATTRTTDEPHIICGCGSSVVVATLSCCVLERPTYTTRDAATISTAATIATMTTTTTTLHDDSPRRPGRIRSVHTYCTIMIITMVDVVRRDSSYCTKRHHVRSVMFLVSIGLDWPRMRMRMTMRDAFRYSRCDPFPSIVFVVVRR